MNPQPIVYAVDDDPAVLKSLRWLIESARFEVQTFASGISFLQHYDAKRPGCLILDMRMPGMNGLQVQSHLLEQGVDLPVILMTGHADVPVCTESFRNGAFDFLEKPANDEFLLRRIAEAIAVDTERLRRKTRQADFAARLAELTPRELEVMEFVADGMTLKQIAGALGISIQTVAKHRAKVFEKLAVDTVAELTRLALQRVGE